MCLRASTFDAWLEEKQGSFLVDFPQLASLEKTITNAAQGQYGMAEFCHGWLICFVQFQP